MNKKFFTNNNKVKNNRINNNKLNIKNNIILYNNDNSSDSSVNSKDMEEIRKKQNVVNIIEETQEFNNFDWKTYINNYIDLKIITNKFDAWKHWINHGKTEGRVLYSLKLDEIKKYKLLKEEENKIIQMKTLEKKESSNDNENINNNDIINVDVSISNSKSNKIIFKTVYDFYGLHFFGWKGCINNFIDNFDLNSNKNFIYNVFFDEWIEKLLIWGNQIQSNKILKNIEDNNYKIITFIHNPPVEKWENPISRQHIMNETLTTDNFQLNENVIKKIEENNISDKIVYFYTLSNWHKEYVYNKYPKLKNKVLSIYHPICMEMKKEESFDFNKFLVNKQIYHIGWWLRNFKSFNNFIPPDGFTKIILLKNDFKEIFEKKIGNKIKKDIIIINELINEEYIKIFTHSCVYLDLVDGIANNILLECIKYNTPIILKRLPSLEEYIGTNYPLFFTSCQEIYDKCKDETIFLDLISKANNYLINLNKKHISLESFNIKINYDLYKVKIKLNSYKLTWFCITYNEKNININIYIDEFIEQFLFQKNQSEIKLIIFISKNENENETNNIMKKYLDYKNITFIQCSNDFIFNIDTFLSEVTDSEYLLNVKITDIFDKYYSQKIIEYLDKNMNCDVVLSSYNISKKYKSTNELLEIKYKKDTLFLKNNLPYSVIPHRFVWRKGIYTFFKLFNNLVMNDNNIIEKYINSNLNVICFSSKPLYTIFI